MKNDPKNVGTPIIVILYLLAILFLGYGIYMAYDAVVYVNTYDANDAVSAANMLQYVIAASASYFGFAIVIFAAACIMQSLNKVQKNLYKALSFGYVQALAPEAATEEPHIEEPLAEEQITAADAGKAAVDDAEKAEAVRVQPPLAPADINITEAPEILHAPEAEEVHETEESIEEAVSSDAAEMPENLEAAGISEAAETGEAAGIAEAAETGETAGIAEATGFSEADEVESEPSTSLAEELSSQFLAEPDSAPVPEITVPQQPTPEAPVIRQPEPEIVAYQQPTPEIVINHSPEPEIVVQQPATPVTIEQQRPSPEAPAAEPAARPAEKLEPPTVPEEILQTKRKRGLKYENFSMDMEDSSAGYPGNLSDTIRLKKGDREGISSSFIKDILEKNE